ncbi:MAG: hypothetical protein KDE53_00095, partial [Caldilineaceae bacterium]|nr:hypothetical protein [Caldilineaceae bacterium]
ALCTQIHNGWNLCLAWQTKGQVAACRGEWALALHCYETALDHGQQAGFVIGGVVTPLLLGELLRSMGETVRAQKLHYGAYIVAVKKAPFLLHAAHAQLAIHAYQRNQITSGDQWLASALESQPNGAIGRAWCVLADLPRAVVQQAQVKGNWTEALPVVETALDEASARQLPLYRPQLLLAQGTVLTALERYVQAEAVFQEALATATVATLRPIRWHLYWELSHLYQRQERTVEEQQMAHLARQEGDLLGPSFSGSVYAQPG